MCNRFRLTVGGWPEIIWIYSMPGDFNTWPAMQKSNPTPLDLGSKELTAGQTTPKYRWNPILVHWYARMSFHFNKPITKTYLHITQIIYGVDHLNWQSIITVTHQIERKQHHIQCRLCYIILQNENVISMFCIANNILIYVANRSIAFFNNESTKITRHTN